MLNKQSQRERQKRSSVFGIVREPTTHLIRTSVLRNCKQSLGLRVIVWNDVNGLLWLRQRTFWLHKRLKISSADNYLFSESKHILFRLPCGVTTGNQLAERYLGTLLYSRKPAERPCPETADSNPNLHTKVVEDPGKSWGDVFECAAFSFLGESQSGVWKSTEVMHVRRRSISTILHHGNNFNFPFTSFLHLGVLSKTDAHQIKICVQCSRIIYMEQ